jgi:hypothetical protein
MELVAKRTFIMLALVAATSVGGLSLGSAAYAGEDGDGDTSTTAPRSSSDSGGSPSGGVNTGGGGTAGSDASTLPIALGGLGALAGGSLLLRRFAREDG